MIPLAHAGDWLASLAILAPVLLFPGALAVSRLRDRRRRRAAGKRA